MRLDLTARGVVGLTLGLAAYSYVATILSAAWFMRRDDALAFWESVLWAAARYGIWIPVGLVVWAVLRRWPDWRGAAILTALGPPAASLGAGAAWAVDLAFRGHPTPTDWASPVLDRLPVALLFYTAVVFAGFAVAQGWKAVQGRQELMRLSQLLDTARAAPASAGEHLLVSIGRGRTSVVLDQIEWLSAAGNYVVVHWDGQEGLVRETLQAMADRLDQARFARIHRSTVVNLARVRTLRPLPDGAWRLTLDSGAELVASRTYRDAVLERLGRA